MGPPAYDLGGGVWMSPRAHVVVEVLGPGTMALADYHDLLDTQLFQLLTRICPIYVTFDWAVNCEGGFVLDVDQLDYGALGAD